MWRVSQFWPWASWSSERRAAFRNTVGFALLLAVLWVPVCIVHAVRIQDELVSQMSIGNSQQAYLVSNTLIRSQNLLDWLATSLAKQSGRGSWDEGISSEFRQLLLSVHLESRACIGFAVLSPSGYKARSCEHLQSSVLDIAGFPGWQELAKPESSSADTPRAVYGPYQAPSGSLNVVLVSRIRLPDAETAGILACEFSLQQLLAETQPKVPRIPLLQELVDENGKHLCGVQNLQTEFPVPVGLEVGGRKWQLLTRPASGWFNMFPAEILYLSSLGFVLLSGGGSTIWWLTLRYSRLNHNLFERTEALNDANMKIRNDLHELRATQRKLAATELRTRVIYDQIAIGVALIDSDSGRIRYVNPCGCLLLNAPEATLQQFRLHDLLIHAESGPPISQSDAGPVAPGEYFAKSGENSIIRIHITIAPVLARDGEPERTLVVLKDITQGWQAQEELRENEQRFRVLIDTLPGPLFYVDSDYRCRFANDIAVQVLKQLNGDSFVHPLGRRNDEFLSPPLNAFMQPLIELALRSEPRLFETTPEFEQLFGSAWIGFHRPFTRNGRIEGVFAFFFEITEQRRNEAERRELAKRMAEAHRMETVGTLAGGVAHEFNNMLQVVLGLADVLLVHLQNDAVAQEHLKNIRVSSRRASDLTRQLLAFARFQTPSPLQLNFADLIPASIKLLRHAAGRDIQLTWDCEPTLDDVLIDQSQLDLILANLIFNSRHALDGKGTIAITARNLSADAAAEPGLPAAGQPSVLLSVCDQGCGMTPEVQARMFDPFFTTRAIGDGTGLGLSTVYGLVIQNNGRIDVRSAPGNGTSIHMLFPACNGRRLGSGKKGGRRANERSLGASGNNEADC